MIKLSNALLTDALPPIVGNEPWAKAMAVAVRNQMRQLLAYADRVTLYAAVDAMPDKVLSVMAADMRVPQWSETYDSSIKRSLIRGALTYWSKAGTKEKVEQLCRDIFGDATVIEWFEYGGTAGYFKVSTSNPSITEANVEDFKAAVNAIKRLSAWLQGIEIELSTENMEQVYGFFPMVAEYLLLKQES